MARKFARVRSELSHIDCLQLIQESVAALLLCDSKLRARKHSLSKLRIACGGIYS